MIQPTPSALDRIGNTPLVRLRTPGGSADTGERYLSTGIFD
ncbi:MAG: hypothetical protein ACYC9I_04715 [Desulfuromonadales bacterium]